MLVSFHYVFEPFNNSEKWQNLPYSKFHEIRLITISVESSWKLKIMKFIQSLSSFLKAFNVGTLIYGIKTIHVFAFRNILHNSMQHKLENCEVDNNVEYVEFPETFIRFALLKVSDNSLPRYIW